MSSAIIKVYILGVVYMNVLLTGSAGFLGRNLYVYLKNEGYNVIGMDKVASPTTDMIFDFTFPMLRYHLLCGKRVEAIVHIGGVADVYFAAANPTKTYETNIIGTNYIVSTCKELDIPIIYASTWEVYGEPQYQPIDEMHPTNPDHPYSISKLAGELVIKNKLDNVKHCILRLGTLYGVGMRETAVIPKFIKMAANGENITIHGSGEQFRQFTHVNDACQAFDRALTKGTEGVYNIVADEKISIKMLAESLKDYYEDLDITYEEARAGDVASSIISSDLAKEKLGWKPMFNFTQGLEEMIDFYNNMS